LRNMSQLPAVLWLRPKPIWQWIVRDAADGFHVVAGCTSKQDFSVAAPVECSTGLDCAIEQGTRGMEFAPIGTPT
jgi:hypothetical protein